MQTLEQVLDQLHLSDEHPEVLPNGLQATSQSSFDYCNCGDGFCQCACDCGYCPCSHCK